uniref:Uncharacterized protein n=1 Tax=Ciona savignyi TaxID=51511 RepID=H2YS77_CIOSA
METAARKGREKMVKQGEVEQEVEEFGADIVDVEILSDGDMAGWIPDVHTIPADWGSLKISTALNMGVIHNHQTGGKRGASPTLETDSTPKKKAMVKFQRPLLVEEETKITDVDFTPKEVVFLRGATLTQTTANEEDFDPRSSEQHPEDAMNNHQEELDAREIQKEEEVAEEDADGFKMLLHAAELSAVRNGKSPRPKTNQVHLIFNKFLIYLTYHMTC